MNSPNLKGVPVLDHPFQFLSLFHLQSRGHWRRTNEIILAVLTAPLNYLQFGNVSHAVKLALQLVIGKLFFSQLLRQGAPKPSGMEQERNRALAWSSLVRRHAHIWKRELRGVVAKPLAQKQ